MPELDEALKQWLVKVTATLKALPTFRLSNVIVSGSRCERSTRFLASQKMALQPVLSPHGIRCAACFTRRISTTPALASTR